MTASEQALSPKVDDSGLEIRTESHHSSPAVARRRHDRMGLVMATATRKLCRDSRHRERQLDGVGVSPAALVTVSRILEDDGA